ncbi:unnamed protein product [Bemisia tabaci]|uniref:Uncharacterized protein n=1 Tax=Bemisia tabaci TaxID=7038 RepID=A0A9P0A262_BEMTA|nr:unnamed protein product [Bemisia tabaci]
MRSNASAAASTHTEHGDTVAQRRQRGAVTDNNNTARPDNLHFHHEDDPVADDGSDAGAELRTTGGASPASAQDLQHADFVGRGADPEPGLQGRVPHRQVNRPEPLLPLRPRRQRRHPRTRRHPPAGVLPEPLRAGPPGPQLRPQRSVQRPDQQPVDAEPEPVQLDVGRGLAWAARESEAGAIRGHPQQPEPEPKRPGRPATPNSGPDQGRRPARDTRPPGTGVPTAASRGHLGTKASASNPGPERDPAGSPELGTKMRASTPWSGERSGRISRTRDQIEGFDSMVPAGFSELGTRARSNWISRGEGFDFMVPVGFPEPGTRTRASAPWSGERSNRIYRCRDQCTRARSSTQCSGKKSAWIC